MSMMMRRRIVMLLAVLLIVAGSSWAWRINRDLRRVEHDLGQSLSLLDAGDLDRWPALCASTAALQQSLASLRATLGPLPLLTAGLGERAALLGPLLDLGDQAGIASARVCGLLPDLAADFRADQPVPAQLIARLSAVRPEFVAIQADLAALAAALTDLPRGGFTADEQARLLRAEALLADAQLALRLAAVLPTALGADSPRSYLVALQNPDELRPSGGFLSAAGLLRVAGGQIESLELRDSTRIDNLQAAAYPLAPDPIRRYMLPQAGGPALWVFRDANWSPDFPTAAAQINTLYALGQGERADAVLAITPAAIARILAATGPLRIDGLSSPVAAANVDAELRNAYDDAIRQGRPEDRKSFVSRLAESLLTRLASADRPTLLALAQALLASLEARDLQVAFFSDPPIAAVLAERGWDGAVRPADGDFLMTASANVGYTKVGPNIDLSLDYRVDLRDPQQARASLQVIQRNRSPGAPLCVPLERREAGYAPLTVGCYWNYLRVLIPGAAQLSDLEVPQVPDRWMLSGDGDAGRVYRQPGPGGTRMLGVLSVTPPQSATTLRFRYDLPPQVVAGDGEVSLYRLRIQRQPGQIQTAAVQIELPAGAELIAAAPLPQSRDGQRYNFTFRLDRDQQLQIRYR